MTNIGNILIAKFVLATVISAAVVAEDLRHRRIPNALCAALFFVGLVSDGLARGRAGLADGFVGATLGFLIFLLPYGLGGMGGGDVKLMAGFGALTGFRGIVPALFLVSVAGALTSILYMAWQRARGRTLAPAIPYAPAIAAGSLLVAFSQIGGR